MSETKSVELGALSPSLRDQGFADDNGHLQKDAEAISRLYVRGILTAPEREKAYRRLIKRLYALPAPPQEDDGR